MSSNSKECSSNTSNNNNNGLNFGQKTYFEDDNNSNNNNNDNNSSNNVGGKIGKRNNNAQNGIITPRCQVEGCNVDLSDAKSYYSRHKVCGMHSKFPLVIVNGIQQRFCQQCSRFHQLPEFDQGKRSCRRRLAGHNERRRKPPPGSLLSPRLGHLSSSLFSDSTSRSGFLLDFSLHSRPPGRDLWPGSKTSEAVSGSPSLGKFHRNPWPGNQSLLSVNTEDPLKMYQHGSAGETSFTIPSGECVAGISSDSTCALSLLSNQTWCSTDGSSNPDLGSLVNLGAASISQPTSTSVTLAHLPNNNSNNIPSWNFKSNQNEADNIGWHGGLGQFSHATNTPLHSDLLMELEHDHDHSRGQVHWSL